MTRAILINKTDDGQTASLTPIEDSQLPDGDVQVDVAWSTLNYKDALAITGSAPVVRNFPMVPGIDFAGHVAESVHPNFKPGDAVVLNGWGVGETHWGGLAERARVKGNWLIHLPEPLTMRDTMIVGTAGYTAMLCVMALERHGITPESGPVVVTGAAGGVGSVATMLLARLGFEVAAVTGRTAEADYLHGLGATSIVDRAELEGKPKALAKERWAAGIDVAGGNVLANLLSSIRYRGVIACCGLAAGMNLPTSVAPFILRGVSLIGVDSVMCPIEHRRAAWARLAQNLDLTELRNISAEVPLEEVIGMAPKFLRGEVRGRIVVPISRR